MDLNDLFFNQVVLLLHFDGANNSTTFTDSSSYNRTATAYGNAKISTTQSKFGGSSGYFDGSGDYLQLTPILLGTVDFTIEFWIYATGAPNNNQVVFTLENFPNTSGIFVRYSSTSISLACGNSDIITTSFSLNQWIHFAIVRYNGMINLYKDGVGATLVSFTNNLTDAIFYIGRPSNVNSYNMTGYLDDLRITKGKARYTANFDPPIRSHPDSMFFNQEKTPLVSNLYYRGTLLSFYDCEQTSGALQDLMLNAPLSVTGSPSYDQTSIIDDYWAGKSITLDTADSFSGDFHSLSGMTTFTVHFYIKTSAISQPIITKTGVFSIALNSSGQIVFSINSNSITSSQAINSNTMRQVTAVFDSGYLLLFIDGEMELFQLFPETTITDTNTENLVIGGFDGTIDEIAFYSTAMKFFDSKNAYEAATNDTSLRINNTDDMVYVNPGAAPVEFSYYLMDEFSKAEEFDTQDGGNYYIEGVITIKGQPVSRKVCLCDRHSGRFIRVTWSDPYTGVYRFNKVKNERFFIWTQDYEDQYNPVSSIPVVLPL